MIARILLVAVRAFQWLVSPLLPRACRFHPSCSEYAAVALSRHGALRGCYLIVKRLARCHPLCEGGVDPVP